MSLTYCLRKKPKIGFEKKKAIHRRFSKLKSFTYRYIINLKGDFHDEQFEEDLDIEEVKNYVYDNDFENLYKNDA
ncbi:17673_t:CDS:2, partial [Cetraspora pellucida]